MALPPGPRIPALLTVWHWLRRPFEFFEECRRAHGPEFTMRLPGLPPLVVFSDPADVKEIFADDGDLLLAGRFNLSLRAFLGEHSVLMLDGKEHLRQRRLLLPPFHGERMHAYGQVMLDAAHDALDRWPLRRPFPVHAEMQKITLEVILRAVFGIDEVAPLAELSRLLAELLDIAAWPPLLIPALQRDLGPLSPWGRFLRKGAVIERLLLDQIRRRRAELAAGAQPAARADVLSLLVAARDESGQALTDEELRDELVTLLVAGHETTATALAWAFRWILATPSIEDRLRAELAGAAGAPDRIAKLDLLDAVVRETLRLQPVVPIVGRILDRPARVGAWDLPAGTGVVCSIYLAHCRPEAYPDPTRFDPDRFLGTRPTPQEFFPFGGGNRRCIGMAFALHEMKMVLAAVLSRASLRIADDRPIRPVRRSITLTPSRGMLLELTRRAPRPLREAPQRTAAA